MKSLIVANAGNRVGLPLLTFFGGLMVLAEGVAFAAEHSIAKTMAPDPVLVLSKSHIYPGVGFTSFYVQLPDIPSGTLNAPKQLLGIQWSTTYYPQTLNEKVELCYYRPFSSQESCREVFPNSSGIMTFFNDQPFGHGSRVIINHHVLGGVPPYARPAGVDSVVFKYSY